MELELGRIRIFDVLRNELSGELGVVMGMTGGRLELRGENGSITQYKFGKYFSRVCDDEAVSFRARAHAARKLIQAQSQNGKKRRPRTVAGLLRKLSKKR